MDTLEAELERARALDVDALADGIESIGFDCTRCGACCRADGCDDAGHEDAGETTGDVSADAGSDADAHTATVFPDEVRALQERTEYDWRDVARPMPYGLERAADGTQTGTTFEWALQTDGCGDCTFYEESDGVGACTVHEDRPLICRTYPFSVALGGTSQPMGEAVDADGLVRAHECEGLGRDIERGDAEELASALKERAMRELVEAIAVREQYEPETAIDDGVVVFDSEGAKDAEGHPFDRDG